MIEGDRPEAGDSCLVAITGKGVWEGEVICAGKEYEVLLDARDHVVTVPDSEVWKPANPSEI